MKALLKGLALLVLAVALAVSAYVTLRLDSLLKEAIVTYGPQVTKTSIAVGSIHVSPILGSARIDDLAVGNPKGFSDAKSFSAQRIRAALEPKSLMGDTIVVDLVEVDGAKVSLEGQGSSSNLSRIEANADAFSGSLQKKIGGTGKPETKSAKPSKNILIKKFILKGAKATVRYGLISGKPLSVDLPDITLENLGGGDKGSAIQEIIARVTRAIQGAAVKTAAQPLKGLEKTAQSLGKDLTSQIGGLFGKKKK